MIDLTDGFDDDVRVVPGGVRLLVLGRQGAGKGTQAVRLASHYGIPHISTGDMFRAALAAGTPFGKRAGAFMQKGELVPDAVVIGVVAERLAADDALTRGFVLDGFPRTRAQADELQRLLAPLRLDAAVDIDVPRSVVLERMMSRRREDDTPEAITRRLDLYDRETGPLLDFYEELGLLAGVDGVGDPDEVFRRVLRAVDDLRLDRSAPRVPAA